MLRLGIHVEASGGFSANACPGSWIGVMLGPPFKHCLKRAECMGSDNSGKESSCESNATSAKGLGLGKWLFEGCKG
eukprot:s10_g46.t3